MLIAAVLSLGLLSLYSLPAASQVTQRQPSHVWRQMADGLRYVSGSQPILGVLLVTVALNVFAFPYMQILSVMARDVLHMGASSLGFLAAGDGFGCLIGALIIAWRGVHRRRGFLFLGGSMAMCLTLTLFSMSRWFVLSWLLLVAEGLCEASFGAMQSTIILGLASDSMRGRAMGALTLAIGSQPLGILLMGSLAAWLGAPAAIAACAAVAGVLVVSVLVRVPDLRRH